MKSFVEITFYNKMRVFHLIRIFFKYSV